ncbi:MAG: hypothetical protein KOO69_08290 [Victivallales bacterium]|nr:hypothetical protein [Victivallales bacterium]
MLPFDRAYLEELTEDNLINLAYLDSLGFLLGPDEKFEDFRQRLLKLFDVLKDFELKLEQGADEVEIFDGIIVCKDKRIPIEIIEEAGKLTEHYYRFSINWAPGFFMSKDVGLLWGGCALSDTEQLLTVFLIRANFMNKSKWFIYDRRELLAHELCHTARHVINDNMLEEFFAYQTAPSKLRRYMGNCFIYKHDAILFLLPTIILLVAQMIKTFSTYDYPSWPFWIFALSYPAFLLIRNNIGRVVFFRACSKLIAFGFADASAILFRCNWHNVKEISLLASPEAFRRFVQKKASSELNWKLIQHRFVIHSGEAETEELEGENDAA